MKLLEGKRVLLVEDELLIALHAEDILHDLGAQIVGPAISLSEAETLAEDEEFELAMLDRNLNGNLSDDLARRLADKGVKVVLATGYDDFRSNGFQVVNKPFDDHSIRLAFERVLEGKDCSGH